VRKRQAIRILRFGMTLWFRAIFRARFWNERQMRLRRIFVCLR
jgi:hypothetical protein